MRSAIRASWLRATEPMLSLNHEARRETTRALKAARIGTFAEWYVALSYLVGIVVAVVALGLGFYAVQFLGPGPFAPWVVYATVPLAAVGVMLLVRLGFLVYPRIRASGRGRRIEQEMPAIVTLGYALARGGMDTVDIFRAISKERAIYGEAAVECAVVVRDVDWFGMDIAAALKDVSTTTPSPTFKSFAEGLLAILNSGADPRDFFRHQAEHQFTRQEAHLEKGLETASFLAEAYVSGLLVLPLLLIVVLSALAPLGSGLEVLIPFIVFAMIPLGTFLYLILVDTMMPAESLTVPIADPGALEDFGVHNVRARESSLLPPPWKVRPEDITGDDPEAMVKAIALARRMRFRLFVERVRSRVSSAFKRLGARMIAHPADAVEISGVAALIFAGGGGAWLWYNGVRGTELLVAATTLVVLAALVGAVPVSIFHELRLSRARKVEAALPEMLSNLAGFNERGIGLLQSFQILGRTATGPLQGEMQSLERDVTWNGNLGGALRRLRARVNTLRMTKLTLLLERASQATSNLKEVLDIAAKDAEKSESIRQRKQQAMTSYVVVVYVVFAIFLYVVYMVATLFYGDAGFAALSASAASGALSRGLAPAEAKLMFMQAVVVQGVCCGLVAGRLGDGYWLSGLKHAAILGAGAWLVFILGVI